MNIEVRRKNSGKYILQVGDIVYIVGVYGTVIQIRNGKNICKYMIRYNSYDGYMSNAYENLEDLTKGISQVGFKIYSKDEYKLELVRK